jgi:hypothetical protein
MKRTLITAGTVVLFAAASYAGQEPEVDQIAQQQMIGLSKKKILACLGAPAKRVGIGATDIWTYPIGEAHFESPFFAPAFLLAPSASAGDKRACDVNVILTNGAVSQVVYRSADGGPLPLGRQCLFAVQSCTSPVAPFSVKAAY